MPLDSAQIELAQYRNECAPIALINLLKLCGIEPPPIGIVIEGLDALAFTLHAAQQARPGQEGFTPFEVFGALNSTGRLVCLLGIVPPSLWQDPRPVLTHFLDDGCYLLLFFTWRAPDGELFPHVVVAEGYDERGYIVLDGEGFPEGAVLELEPRFSDEELAKMVQDRKHGSRVILPFYSVATADNPLGIHMYFVVAYLGGNVRRERPRVR